VAEEINVADDPKYIFYSHTNESMDDENENVDFEPEEDVMEDAPASSSKSKGGKTAAMDDERYSGRSGIFESLDTEAGAGPARCKLIFAH
jgi:hypothetical protein